MSSSLLQAHDQPSETLSEDFDPEEALSLEEIESSGLFDREFYEGENPDVPEGHPASIKHFLHLGGREGRSPHLLFDSKFYLEKNPDVRESGMNPLLHYLRHGRFEERLPNRYLINRELWGAEAHEPLNSLLVTLLKAQSGASDTPEGIYDIRKLFAPVLPQRRLVRSFIGDVFLRGDGLEVGALQDPLPLSRETTVKYVDRFSVSDLRNHYPELKTAPLVEVDIIDNGEELHSLPADSQDFLVANHFLEHTQDPIRTLKNFCRVVRPGGYLYIAVPDQESSFDKDRTPTTLEHLIEDHQKGGNGSRLEHYKEWVTLCEPHFGRVYSHEEVVLRVEELEKQDYSIHFHCWKADGFREFLDFCATREGVGFRASLLIQSEGELIALLKVEPSSNQKP